MGCAACGSAYRPKRKRVQVTTVPSTPSTPEVKEEIQPAPAAKNPADAAKRPIFHKPTFKNGRYVINPEREK